MPAILLDIDGVLHVSGAPIAGGADAVLQLRENGHRLRFVTNNTTHSRRRHEHRRRAGDRDVETQHSSVNQLLSERSHACITVAGVRSPAAMFSAAEAPV